MDQDKIGKFIALCRKEKKLTQSELASKLRVSDRAISNWENGKNMPDLSLFKPLCEILDITVNDLFNGKRSNMKKETIEITEKTIDYANQEINKFRKKGRKKIFLILIGLIVVLGIIFGISDYNRIIYGEKPNFMIRITNGAKQTHYYLGLGYMMERKVGVSYKESLIDDEYVRFGLWLFTWNVEILESKPDNLILRSNSNEITANTGSYCWTETNGKKSLNICSASIGPVSMNYDSILEVNKEDKIYFKLNNCKIKNINLYDIPKEKENYTDDLQYLKDYQVTFEDNNYINAPELSGNYIIDVNFNCTKGTVWYAFKLAIN